MTEQSRYVCEEHAYTSDILPCPDHDLASDVFAVQMATLRDDRDVVRYVRRKWKCDECNMTGRKWFKQDDPAPLVSVAHLHITCRHRGCRFVFRGKPEVAERDGWTIERNVGVIGRVGLCVEHKGDV